MSHKAIVIMIVMSAHVVWVHPPPLPELTAPARPALTLPKTEIALCCDGAGTTGQLQERNKAQKCRIYTVF